MRLTKSELQRFSSCPVHCPRSREKISSLADFLAVISDAIRSDDTFWFRGHHDFRFSLTPSALRYSTLTDRDKALRLMSEFKRIADIKLKRPPLPEKNFEWALIAQHYGLPTRLLDWTESATTALYFASLNDEKDGLVFLLNPVELNRSSFPTTARIFDPEHDGKLISAYLSAGARRSPAGRLPVAVNPVQNSERLIMQKGVFTLHGSRFDLDHSVPTLVAIPILRDFKPRLRSELQRIGVDEMTLFPELEHACSHLKRRAGLETAL